MASISCNPRTLSLLALPLAVAVLISGPFAPGIEGRAGCGFELRAKNTHPDRSLYLELYESKVRRVSTRIAGVPTVFSRTDQLKISNHRVGPGKTMTRAYTAPGACDLTRTWTIVFKRAKAGPDEIKTFSTSTSTEFTPTGKRLLDFGDLKSWF